MADLDRAIKLGAVTLPRWIIGRDAWEEGDEQLFLMHLSEPRFVARWQVGEDGVTLKPLVWIDGEDDEAIAIFDFVWTDAPPGDADFRALMRAARDAIDHWFTSNGEE